MGTGERFLTVIGNPRVMRALAGTVLLYTLGFIVVIASHEIAVEGSTILLVVLCAVPYLLVIEYLKGRPSNLIQTVEEVVKETDQMIKDDATPPEDRIPLQGSEPVPALDVVDPATPDSAIIDAVNPVTSIQWAPAEEKPENGD